MPYVKRFKKIPGKRRALKKHAGAHRRFKLAPVRRSGYSGRFTGPSKELKFFDLMISTSLPSQGSVNSNQVNLLGSAGCGIQFWGLTFVQSGAGTVGTPLNLITQGAGESQRIGRQCMIKSIQLNLGLEFEFQSAVNSTANNFRWAVIYDTQTNGAAPNITDIYRVPANAGPQNTFIGAVLNLENSQRFKTIMTGHFSLNPTYGNGGALTQCRYINKYKRCNLPLDTDGASTNPITVSNIKSGAIYFVCGYDDQGAGTDCKFTAGTFRFRYSDD